METALANAKQTEPKERDTVGAMQAASAAPSLHPMLQLQQQAGNQAVQAMLRQRLIQSKLTISKPGDPEEREADQVADHVMRAHVGFPISGSSSSDEEDESDAGTQKNSTIQRRATGPGSPNGGNGTASSISKVLSSGGRPLDAATRSFFEPRIGHDFSGVRVHTDPSAASSARSIQARAFTAGEHIVFGEGQFAPHTDSGAHLLAHELTHVAQQGKAPLHPGAQPLAAKTYPSLSSAPIKVQREEDPNPSPPANTDPNQKEPEDTTKKDLGFWSEATISALSSPALAVGETAYGLVRATWHGFFAEFKSRDDSIADKIGERIKEFATSSKELLSFFPLYWWGLIKGIFSPITGLFDLAKLAIQLPAIAVTIGATAWKNREKLATDAQNLGKQMSSLGSDAWTAIKGFASHPIDTAMQLGPLLDAAKAKANSAAEQGGHKIAGMLYANADKPIPELGETAGEVIGTVAVNIALIVFTEGIGDAIAQIAGKLGEVASWLSKFGKGAKLLGGMLEGLVTIMAGAGKWIAAVEHLIGTVAGAILKPLEPVLREFGEMMSGLKTFLKDLLEAAEAAESEEASAAAKTLSKGASEGGSGVPKPGGEPVEPTPRPAPPPKSPEPKMPDPNSPGPSPSKPAPSPKSPSQPKDPAAPPTPAPKEPEFVDDKFVAAVELDEKAAYKEFENWIKLDPKREVGIWMDPASKEYIVVQGEESLVDNRWIFKDPSMNRRWVLVEHYHPGEDTVARLASTGDFRAMMHDQIFGTIPDGPISTNIRWIDPATGDHLVTEIGYTPHEAEPYYIKFKDVDGTEVVKRFKEDPWIPGSDYEEFLRSRGSGPTTHSGTAPPGPAAPGTPPPAAPTKPGPGNAPKPADTKGPGAIPAPQPDDKLIDLAIERLEQRHNIDPARIPELRAYLRAHPEEIEDLAELERDMPDLYDHKDTPPGTAEPRGGSKPGELGKLGKDLSRNASREIFGEKWITDEAMFTVTTANGQEVSFIADIGAQGSKGEAVLIEAKYGSGAGFEAGQEVGYPIISTKGGVPSNESARKFAKTLFPGWQPGKPTPPIKVRIDYWSGTTRRSIWLP